MKRILENIKIAFKSLGLNKLRSFLTMLGIIIGVGSVVAVMSVGAGAEASITENIQSMGTNVITITPGREQVFAGNREVRMESNAGQGGGFMVTRRFGDNEDEEIVAGELYLEDVDALKEKAKLLNEVVPVLSGFNSTFSYMSWSGNVSITATTEDYLSLQSYEMDKGSFFTASDVSNSSNVVILGYNVVTNYFGKANPVGEEVKINGKNFTVMGILKSAGSTFGMSPDDSVYIPITTAQNKIYGVDTVDQIIAKVESEDVMDQAIDEAKATLRVQHHILPGESNDFEIRSSTQLLEIASSVTDILIITLTSIAAISLLVGGIGIMNIMFVSVTERTREIGIRKAIGAKNRDILAQFLTESVVLSLSGGIIGVGFAGFVTWILGTFTTLSSLITAFPIILALSFSTVIGLVFGILPAMRAARLNPIDSLRHE
ncbi:MAG: FtsX-like permease family protein [Actinobacteria bacterium]|nr:FtsX-like permease family protein [Actinomycetota bacterium]